MSTHMTFTTNHSTSEEGDYMKHMHMHSEVTTGGEF